MTDHERAAMEAAIAETILRMDSAPMSIHALIEHGWLAGRAYEPPASEAEERCARCGNPRVRLLHFVTQGHAFVAAPSEAR